MAEEVITALDQITPGWLSGVLRGQGLLPRGDVVAVRAEECHASVGGSVVAQLTLDYSADAPEDAPVRMVSKLSHPEASLTTPREVEFYRRVAPLVPGLPVVRCYDAAWSEESGRLHLLLEDLSETHDPHPPSMLPPPQARAGQIVDALAALHAAWWDHPRLGREVGALPTEESLRADMRWCQETWPPFVDFLGDRLSPGRRDVYERVLASFLPLQLDRLVGRGGLTLVHGDPHAGNFLYPRDPEQDTLRIIDWKSWQVAIGVSDLAHMMAVFWFPAHRARFERPLLDRYHGRLLAGGVAAYDREACWADYRLSVIGHLFYPVWQWLAGIPDFIWWHHLERLMLAFQDLDCGGLLA